MKNQREKLKYLAAFVLLVSFFLPMSSCSYTVPLELGTDGTPPGAKKVKTETRTVTIYAMEYIDPHEPGSWLNLFSFLWPILVIALQYKLRGKRARILLASSGAILSAVSAAVIYVWADIGKPLIGAYVGWCAALGLFVIYLSELVEGIKGKESLKFEV